MKKIIRANCYTEEKYVHDKSGSRLVCLPDGKLFSHGIYPTNITPNDLPDSFVETYLREKLYLNTANIKDLVYKPNYFSDNHLFKDDFLFISYSEPLKTTLDSYGFSWIEKYDQLLWGHSIVSFVEAVKERSDYPVGDILTEIAKKREWYVRTNPTHPELSTQHMPCRPGAVLICRNTFLPDPRITPEIQEKEAKDFCLKYGLTYLGSVPEDGAENTARKLQERLDQGEDVCFAFLPIGRPSDSEREYENGFERIFRRYASDIHLYWLDIRIQKN